MRRSLLNVFQSEPHVDLPQRDSALEDGYDGPYECGKVHLRFTDGITIETKGVGRDLADTSEFCFRELEKMLALLFALFGSRM